MLNKQGLVTYAIGAVTVCSVIATSQPARSEDEIVTATSINQAPYSQVFRTGSVYAVRKHDYKGSEP